LIPGLVNATKSILKQEQKVFGDIAEARTHYAGTTSGTEERVEATNQMESALSRLMVIIENYPQLNSNQTVQALMDELAGTENRINIARERYNESVKVWNTKIKSFPTSLLIGTLFTFKERTLFQSEENANKAVQVNLDL
jgi:LemA protein